MGQVLHGNATTTHAIRKAIQEAPEEVSNNALANRYGIHFETVKKWRERDTVEDRPSGLEKPCPKTLNKVEGSVSNDNKTISGRLSIFSAGRNSTTKKIESL